MRFNDNCESTEVDSLTWCLNRSPESQEKSLGIKYARPAPKSLSIIFVFLSWLRQDETERTHAHLELFHNIVFNIVFLNAIATVDWTHVRGAPSVYFCKEKLYSAMHSKTNSALLEQSYMKLDGCKLVKVSVWKVLYLFHHFCCSDKTVNSWGCSMETASRKAAIFWGLGDYTNQ